MRRWNGADPAGEVPGRAEWRVGALIALVAVVLVCCATVWTQRWDSGERGPASGPVVSDAWSDLDEAPAPPSPTAVLAVAGPDLLFREPAPPRGAPRDAVMALHFAVAGRDCCSGTALPPPS